MKPWDHCLKRLQSELTIQQFNTWIRPLQCAQDENENQLQLFAPNAFVLEWVKNHYLEKIQSYLNELNLSPSPSIKLEIGTLPKATESKRLQGNSKSSLEGPASRQTKNPERLLNINHEFTFDTYVEGKSNQLARAAGLQIGEAPGTVYNPLFIYGGTGLGKTHLLHAIGNHINCHHPDYTVMYLHSEGFVSEMIKALQHNKIENFKKKVRSVNALLLDDVQFFAGKERSQEEFFHTFNALFESQQQIILTSDRFPREVDGLEDRLKSRFGWGLTVAIEPPDLETRVAILMSKAQTLFNIELPSEVAFFIGQRVRSNIRDLEGALRLVIANSEFTKSPITVEFAEEALSDLIAVQDKQITLENIQKVVAEYYEISVADLLSKSRSRNLARPRQIAMALAKELSRHSFPSIGKAFGGRDHTTVLYAIRKVEELRKTNTQINEDYNYLLKALCQ